MDSSVRSQELASDRQIGSLAGNTSFCNMPVDLLHIPASRGRSSSEYFLPGLRETPKVFAFSYTFGRKCCTGENFWVSSMNMTSITRGTVKQRNMHHRTHCPNIWLWSILVSVPNIWSNVVWGSTEASLMHTKGKCKDTHICFSLPSKWLDSFAGESEWSTYLHQLQFFPFGSSFTANPNSPTLNMFSSNSNFSERPMTFHQLYIQVFAL